MSVYDDYLNHRWDAHFTERFRIKHLMPFYYIPMGGHREARAGARVGNVLLNRRFQRDWGTDRSSLIYDLDPEGERPRQVLRLMNEVEERNAAGFYASPEGAEPIASRDAYVIQTTGHGSRHWLVHRPIPYGVQLDEATGRYRVNHIFPL